MVCSYSQAVELKRAGFPQPEKKTGQFWYGPPKYKGGSLEHVPLGILVESYQRKNYLRRLTCEHFSGGDGGKPILFAPGAIDIMDELISKGVHIVATYVEGVYRVVVNKDVYSGPTLVDVLANVYLSINSQP